MEPENKFASKRSCLLVELEYRQRSFVAINDAVMGDQKYREKKEPSSLRTDIVVKSIS
jgi:hypothetical protein